MPRFRVNNLSVSLADKLGDQVLIPTPDTWDICNYWPNTCHIYHSRCYEPASCQWFISGFPTGCLFNPSIIIFNCMDVTNLTCPAQSTFDEDLKDRLINPVLEAELLDQMRVQLEGALKEIGQRGLLLEESTRPQTREQVEAMEQELTRALEELKRMKSDLE